MLVASVPRPSHDANICRQISEAEAFNVAWNSPNKEIETLARGDEAGWVPRRIRPLVSRSILDQRRCQDRLRRYWTRLCEYSAQSRLCRSWKPYSDFQSLVHHTGVCALRRRTKDSMNEIIPLKKYLHYYFSIGPDQYFWIYNRWKTKRLKTKTFDVRFNVRFNFKINVISFLLRLILCYYYE